MTRQLALTLAFFLFIADSSAQAMVIAVIGKTKNDSFYVASFNGCQRFAAAYPDVTCIYDGPADFQDPRSQAMVVQKIISQGVDGLLISTTDSEHLVERALTIAKSKSIPTIMFDSDLLPEHRSYRMAYVGTDNVNFGKALGDYAKKYKRPTGITEFCIQSGHPTTPNLNERIEGVRLALSETTSANFSSKTVGWRENSRCPLYSEGKRDTAIFQLEQMITAYKPPPVIIAVAGFAQFSQDYIPRIKKYAPRIASHEVVIISADTEPLQLKALSEGLSTANIGQRPFEMGRLGAELLYRYIKHGEAPEKEFYHLDYHYCTPENLESCIVE
ncbi:substrate-binding domain-containing protein [Hahella sp. HN01]|uniref:substrate-binding domain-containing protein n=1 Tax=Hahella sp. HN01 TaxID=2847262 RepID=UPI001C1ED7A0|nr:substrate-binding domain-containing protein [Hahella sp. HN01]MBU6953982.1 substrate-binding domain-containing protein [Hahella sp. HN01]